MRLKLFSRFKLNRVSKSSTNSMILFLSFSNVIGNILNIVGGLFVAKWLLPQELGTFNGFTIITGYIILVQLGVPSGLSRELPFYLGKENSDKAHILAGAAHYWQLILGMFALAISGICSILFLLKSQFLLAAGSMVVGVTVWQALYVTKYLKVLFRTNSDFNKLSWIKLAVAIISIISIVFVYLYGFYGLCIRAVTIALFDFLLTHHWRPIKVKAKWDKVSFLELMRVGLPMYGVANVYGLWPLIQRTLIISLGGPKALGLFAIANMVLNGMQTVSNSIGSVIYPTMASQWGKGENLSQLVWGTLKPFLISFILFVVAVPIGWWLLPIFITSFLPDYSEGIRAAQWMLVVGLFSLTSVFANTYNVIRQQGKRLRMYVLGILGWGITILVLYHLMGFSLEIFPMGMIAAFIIMATLNLMDIRKHWTLYVLNH